MLNTHILGQNTDKRQNSIELHIQGQIETSDQENANNFNEFFANIIGEDSENIPERIDYEITHPFEYLNCTNSEITEIIASLNMNSSNGYDNISTKFIKRYGDKLAPALTSFVNECFVTKEYPETLKIGCVVPIYKCGQKHNISNYRPITKLSVLDKIFEETILKRIKNHLKLNNIIDKNQFGFVDNSSTLAAGINLMDSIYQATDTSDYTAILSIDLSKAFDRVHMKTLLLHLEEIGIHGENLKLFKSFLTGRKQYVQLNDAKSEVRETKNGVPQGSKLAATLFIIYINGIFKLPLKAITQFYADDGVLLFKGNSMENLSQNIRHDLVLLDGWLEKNHLKLNVAKTKILVVKNGKNTGVLDHFIGINYQGQLIESVKAIKYLGLVIDNQLSWDEHTKNVINRVTSISYLIYRARNLIPKGQLWMLYHAHCLTHLAYMNPIWSSCSKTIMNRLQRIQNKLMKTIEGLPRLTPTNTLYKNHLNMEKFAQLQTITALHKITNNKMRYNHDLEQKTQHGYTLRSILNLRQTFHKNTKNKRSIRDSGIKLFNKIPISIRNIRNTHIFRREMIKFLLSNDI